MGFGKLRELGSRGWGFEVKRCRGNGCHFRLSLFGLVLRAAPMGGSYISWSGREKGVFGIEYFVSGKQLFYVGGNLGIKIFFKLKIYQSVPILNVHTFFKISQYLNHSIDIQHLNNITNMFRVNFFRFEKCDQICI